MPSVSVVIPAYNAAVTLPETLASLAAQTFGDFEAIVIDDGSSDPTARVASEFGDPRVRVVAIPKGGVARARNHGIALAEGEFVAFLDADDLWQPEKLARQVSALRSKSAVGFSVTGAVRIDGDSREIEPMPLINDGDTTRTLLLHAMAVGCLSSGMARKDLLEAIGGFDPRFSQCADWDLWLRLSLSTEFLAIADPLVRYRTAAGNMSSNIGLLESDTFAVLDAFFASDLATPHRPLKGQVYGGCWMMCSGAYLHQRRFPDALRCLLSGLRADPASIRRPLGMPRRWASRIAPATRGTG